MVFHGQVLTKELDSYSPHFIVSPEIVHLQPGESKFAQIIQLDGQFPEDRESLLYLQGHFLPASTSSGSSNSVSINTSYVIQMKMFYRPAKLRASFDAVDDVANQLEFKIEGNTMFVFNKSPYFLTINTLVTNKGEVPSLDEVSMIEPFGQINLQLKDPKISSVTWTLINDGGYSTKSFTKKI